MENTTFLTNHLTNQHHELCFCSDCRQYTDLNLQEQQEQQRRRARSTSAQPTNPGPDAPPSHRCVKPHSWTCGGRATHNVAVDARSNAPETRTPYAAEIKTLNGGDTRRTVIGLGAGAAGLVADLTTEMGCAHHCPKDGDVRAVAKNAGAFSQPTRPNGRRERGRFRLVSRRARLGLCHMRNLLEWHPEDGRLCGDRPVPSDEGADDVLQFHERRRRSEETDKSDIGDSNPRTFHPTDGSRTDAFGHSPHSRFSVGPASRGHPQAPQRLPYNGEVQCHASTISRHHFPPRQDDPTPSALHGAPPSGLADGASSLETQRRNRQRISFLRTKRNREGNDDGPHNPAEPGLLVRYTVDPEGWTSENGPRWRLGGIPPASFPACHPGDVAQISAMGNHVSRRRERKICKPSSSLFRTNFPMGITHAWPKFALRPPPGWRSWVLHTKEVPLSNTKTMIAEMNEDEKVELHSFAQFFTTAMLKEVPGTGPSECLLPDEDIEECLRQSLFIKLVDENGVQRPPSWQPTQSKKMRIYDVPQPFKTPQSRRYIVHTMDINDHYDPSPTTGFDPLEEMIGTRVSGVNFVADSKSCYHQFPLPPESYEHYCFYTKKFGWLTLGTLPTGQRHTVGYAQVIAKFLGRKSREFAIALKPNPPRLLCQNTQYIDNFCSTQRNMEDSVIAANAFATVLRRYNVTLNESLEEIISTIGKPFDYRGVHFLPNATTSRMNEDKQLVLTPTAAITHTDKNRQKLMEARDIIEFAQGIVFQIAESIFGVCIFASAIMVLNLAPYYGIYKFFRRRHQQKCVENQSAEIWPCIIPTWLSWIDQLLEMQPRSPIQADEVGEQWVLITDASLKGFGVYLFYPGGVISTGGPWTPGESCSIISELEMKTVQKGLEFLVYPRLASYPCDKKPTINFLIDNTTSMYAWRKRRSSHYYINQIICNIASSPYASRYHNGGMRYIASEDNFADGISRGDGWDPSRPVPATFVALDQIAPIVLTKEQL